MSFAVGLIYNLDVMFDLLHINIFIRSGSSLSLAGKDEFVVIRSNNQPSLNTNSHRQSQAYLPLASDTSESLQCGKATNVVRL